MEKIKTEKNIDHLSSAEMYKVFIVSAVGIALVYSNTFGVPFVLDDGKSIVLNELIHIQSLSQIDFPWLAKLMKADRSVALLSFTINYYLGELNVFGYHLVNLVIHILTTWSVFVFIRTSLNLAGSDLKHSERVATVTALLFAIHPIQTQAVTYIVQREASLACLFYLWALLFYIRARTTKQKRYFVLCFILGALAVGTKQNAAILPVTIFLYEFYFFQERNKEWLKKNYLLLGGIILIPLIIGFYYTGPNIVSWFMRHYAERPFSPLERVLTEQRVLLHYLTLIFFPSPSRFNLDYEFPLSHGFSPATVIAIVFNLLALITAVKLAKSRPILSYFIFWFYINLVIESSIIGLEIVYEHRMYLPSIGLFLIGGLYYSRLAVRFGNFEKMIGGLLVLILLLLGLSTYYRNQVWESKESLWKDVLRKSPNSLRAHNNLGSYYLYQGKLQAARQEFEKMLQLNPNIGIALNNLGLISEKKQKWVEAEKYYRRALQVQPGHRYATSNLANILVRFQRYREAEKMLKYLAWRDPNNYRYHYRLGFVYMREKKFEVASEEFIKVLQLKHDFKDAFAGLWQSLQKIKDRNKVLSILKTALGLVENSTAKQELFSMLEEIKSKKKF